MYGLTLYSYRSTFLSSHFTAMSHTAETTDILVYNLHGMATYFKNQPDK